MSAGPVEDPVRLFVYGSLMSGLPAHHLLSSAGAAVLVGSARTAAGYRLVDLGWYPGLETAGQGMVLGEVYRVPAAALQSLDRYEGTPHHYRRESIELEDGQAAWAYVVTALGRGRSERPRVPDGDWRAWLATRG